MKPPLRCRHDADAVIEGIVSGIVDAIATDHAPHPGSEKMQEFERCPFGITGLETAIGLALSELVHTGRISLMRMVELFTTGPAGMLQTGPRHTRGRCSGRRHVFDLTANGRMMFSSRSRKAVTRRSAGGASAAARSRQSSGAKSYGLFQREPRVITGGAPDHEACGSA